MPGDNNHISFTADEIRKYHQGQLTPGQMHAMEKAALEDPFLADALDGYAVDGVNLLADTKDLSQRLAERLAYKKLIELAPSSRSFGWLRAAAMVVAIAGAGFLVYQFGFNQKEKNIAQAPAQVEATQNNADTTSTAKAVSEDSSGTAKGISTSPAGVSTKSVLQESVGQPAPKKETLPSAEPVMIQSAPAAFEKNATNLPAAPDRLGYTKRADTLTNEAKGFSALQNDKLSENELGLQKKKEEFNANISSAKARRNQAFLQNNIFRGKVTDAQNNPLPFANITNSRDNVGTYSDAQGNFVLTSPDSLMDVQVRSLGFENNNVQLQNGLPSNKVVLNGDRSLTEVVISNKKINSRLREGNMVLEETEPADGWNNYDTYLANNLNIPETYKKKQSGGGEVELSFEVNQVGEPVNIKVTKSLCEICDKEAIRLLKEGPKWKRKAKKGRRTTVTIPF